MLRSGSSPSVGSRPPASTTSGPQPGCPAVRRGISSAPRPRALPRGSGALFSEVRAAVRSGRERALASGEARETVLAGIVSEYFDFITANPYFVRLIEWEALTGSRTLDAVPPHVEAAQEALAALSDELALDPARPGEAAQLLLSVIGLCWFPLVHSGTMLRALGIDAANPDFLQARKRHVIDLVLSGTAGQSHHLTLQPSARPI